MESAMRYHAIITLGVVLVGARLLFSFPTPEKPLAHGSSHGAPMALDSAEHSELARVQPQRGRTPVNHAMGSALDPDVPCAVAAAPEEGEFTFNMRARGTVFGFDGKPIPRSKLGFELQGDGERTPTAYCTCNAQGEFDVPVGAGTWQVLYAGEPGAKGGRLILETVTIQEGADSAYFDFYLPGDRSLAGSLFRDDQDLAHLVIEVFDQTAPSTPVATAYCSTNNKAHASYLASLEEVGHDVPPPMHSPGRGRFEISGLAPAHYQLRAYMDVGKKFYVWHDFEVTGSDYEFPPITLAQSDFLSRREIVY